MTTYGVNRENGTFEKCRAKPENRGRYGCFHDEHHDISGEKEQFVTQYNEAALAKHYESTTGALSKQHPSSVQVKPSAPKSSTSMSPKSMIASKPPSATVRSTSQPAPVRTSNPKRRKKIEELRREKEERRQRRLLTRQQFDASSQKVANAFPESDWQHIRSFTGKIDEITGYPSNMKSKAKYYESASNSVHEFLQSDDPDAQKMREFLGDEVDLKTLSDILVIQVNAMTSPVKWRPKGSASVKRTVMSTVGNDMTKERYVASVMFFGGRCCYCNEVLSKEPGDNQATGEHITPVSPDSSKSVAGGTRYGNMALACRRCNGDRGNTDLQEWVNETPYISEKNKVASVERINAFRKFALYRDYTPEEDAKFKETIRDIESFISKKNRATNNNLTDADAKEINDRMKIAMHDLADSLRP